MGWLQSKCEQCCRLHIHAMLLSREQTNKWSKGLNRMHEGLGSISVKH